MNNWYEFPTRERMRCLLRIDEALMRICALDTANHITDHMVVLQGFCDLRALWQRAELKNDLLAIVDKLQHTLKRLKHKPRIEVELLENWVQKLLEWQFWLSEHAGRLSEWLNKEPLLEIVSARYSIAGGLTSFDCPDYWFFVYQDFAKRQSYLNNLRQKIKPMLIFILRLLQLIRELAQSVNLSVNHGMSDFIPNEHQEVSLVRIVALEQASYVPEFSGNHKRLHIKLRPAIVASTRQDLPEQLQLWFCP